MRERQLKPLGLPARGLRPGFTIEKRYRRPDGRDVWVQHAVSASRGPDGRVRYITAVVADITDRAEEGVAEASRRLAHELRNPLAPISNALHIWHLVEQKPEEAHRLREMMGRQVKQVVRLIDDLLDVSRITRGRIELRKTG